MKPVGGLDRLGGLMGLVRRWVWRFGGLESLEGLEGLVGLVGWWVGGSICDATNPMSEHLNNTINPPPPTQPPTTPTPKPSKPQPTVVRGVEAVSGYRKDDA